ncbi:MAG: hypothetical protein ABI560_08340 [Myxococcales bacterium]
MPHVVIEDASDLGLACRGISTQVLRTGAEILKVSDLYTNRNEHVALVECVVVEEGRSQSFFVQLTRRDRQITVRLLPATDPEKTIGVKRLLGLIAKQVHAASPGSAFGKTNLEEFLA